MKRLAQIAVFAAAVWLEPALRPIIETWQLELAAVGLVGAFVSQGALHGSAFYDGAGIRPIHLMSEVHAPFYVLLAYVAGLHPVAIVGFAMIGMFGFQAFVNKAEGLPVVDPGEVRRYDVGGRAWVKRRLFIGRRRWLQLVFGVAIVVAWTVLN